MDVTHTDPESLLEGLDASQRRAVLATSGPVRIIAGAGAGKTRTITRRIAYACALDVWNPAHALAVTFSTKAAQEMRTRLAALGAGQVKARTFHSAALSQLHLVWDAVTTNTFPQIAAHSPQALAEAVRVVMNRTDLEPADVSDIESEIGWTKVSLIAPQDYPQVCAATHRVPPAGLEPQAFADLAREYERQKAARGVMDFNDILLLVCHIIEDFPRQARRIRGGIDCITVDEYQDVSPLQHRLLRLWLGESTEVCVVGDAAQTIYSFAGATSYYLRDFAREFAPVHSDIVLDRDYRSTPQVVHYANRVLAASPHKRDYLVLTSARADGAAIRPVAYPDDVKEAQGIAARIARLAARGVPLGSIGVLARMNAQLKPIAKALKDRGIAASTRQAPGELSASDEREAELESTRDSNETWEAGGFPDDVGDVASGATFGTASGVIAGGAGETAGAAASQGAAAIAAQAGAGVASAGAVPAGAAPAVVAPSITMSTDAAPTAAATQQRMAQEEKSLRLLAQFQQQREATLKAQAAQSRAAQNQAVHSSQAVQDSQTVQDSQAASEAVPQSGDVAQAQQAVSLSTIHAAKGLEWKYVFVAGCADGIIPFGSPRDDEEREEERRLMYVAVTRAQDALFPSYPRTKAGATGFAPQRPLSPFLRDK